MTSDSSQPASDEKSEIRLRAIEPEDERFLYEVYSSVRSPELAVLGWNEAQQELFLKMQLKARNQSYLMYYPGLDDQVVLFKNQRAGRLIVSRTDEALKLVDITLLPEYRNAGIGTSLIQDLFSEADATQRVVQLQVERTNPQAFSLYERLGFTVTGENQTHFEMERHWRL